MTAYTRIAISFCRFPTRLKKKQNKTPSDDVYEKIEKNIVEKKTTIVLVYT